MSTLATGAPGGMTYCIVDKIEATAKGVPKNISKLKNSQNLYKKFSFWAIKSVALRQSGFSVSRSIVYSSKNVFLGCFPAVISTKPIHSDREKDEVKFKNNIQQENISGYGKVKDIPKVIWKLLTNPTYMFINFAGASDGMTIAGLSTFLPKFIQFQYGYSAGFAAILMGIIIIPAGGMYVYLYLIILLTSLLLRRCTDV